jgi:type VI secretion system secreted protein VgrG
MWLSARAPWFTFTAKSAPRGSDFAVYAFSGREEVSKPYEFSIELVSTSANVDMAALLGTSACLSIRDKSGNERLVHGMIHEMEQLHSTGARTHYRLILGPRFKFLDQIRDHRIYQDMSAPEILNMIFKERGFAAEFVNYNFFYQYEPREYCVQYGESCLHFISRLCEEEGIHFFFTHTEDCHTINFRDLPGNSGPKIPGKSELRFYPGSGQVADEAVIGRVRLRQKVESHAAAYREWNFTNPQADLSVSRKETDAKKAPAQGAWSWSNTAIRIYTVFPKMANAMAKSSLPGNWRWPASLTATATPPIFCRAMPSPCMSIRARS